MKISMVTNTIAYHVPIKQYFFLIHSGLVPLQNLAKAMDPSPLYPGSLFSVLLTGSCKVKLV